MIEYVNILAGLVLLTGALEVIPAMGKHLEKLAKWLGGFHTLIGLIAIILAILVWLDVGEPIIQIAMAIIAGLILIAGILPLIPAMGKQLEKLAKRLGSFQTLIGLITLIVGIWGLL